MSAVFVDRLTVTVGKDHSGALSDVWEEFGVEVGAVPELRAGLYRTPDGQGTLRYHGGGVFASLEASGAFLGLLRATGAWMHYLDALGALPVRVTRLDATKDVVERSAPVLAELYARAREGRISLSRKSVPGHHCRKLFGPAAYEGEPLDTGTVYIPSRRHSRADQYATVYDKRNERVGKGFPDPGPLTRYEAGIGRGFGASLADVSDPTPIFCRVMCPDILTVPDAPAWVPGEDIAWRQGPRPPNLPHRRLARMLEDPFFVRLAQLAGSLDAYEAVLASLFRHNGYGRTEEGKSGLQDMMVAFRTATGRQHEESGP